MYGIENGGRRDPETVFERVRVCRVRSRDRVRLPSRGRARRPSRVGRRRVGRFPAFCFRERASEGASRARPHDPATIHVYRAKTHMRNGDNTQHVTSLLYLQSSSTRDR